MVKKEVDSLEMPTPPTPPLLVEDGDEKGESELVNEVVAPIVATPKVVDPPKLLFEVKSLATQTEPVIVRGEEQFSIHQAIARLLNDVEALKKGLID